VPTLPFISDINLEKAISHVTNSLNDADSFKTSVIFNIKNDTIFKSDLFSNSLDPFAMVFGLELCGQENWLRTEVLRQLYKTYEQKIGEFHQLILGSVDGWKDLGIGDNSKVDLVKEDKSIFIELKNKYNTCNSDALAKVQDKLVKVLKENEMAKAYWGFIVPSTVARSGSTNWRKRVKETQPDGTKMAIIHNGLYKAWGSEVYKIVTGDSDNLKRLYDVLPGEISGIMDDRINFIDIANEITEECTDHLDQIREEIYEYSFVKKK